MKTFSYYVTYHVEDSGEVEASSYDEAQALIEEQMYAVSPSGFSVPWDYVKFNELHEIDDDGEDDEDD